MFKEVLERIRTDDTDTELVVTFEEGRLYLDIVKVDNRELKGWVRLYPEDIQALESALLRARKLGVADGDEEVRP